MKELYRIHVYFNIQTHEGHKQDIHLLEVYDQEEYTRKLDNCKAFLAEKHNTLIEYITTTTAKVY